MAGLRPDTPLRTLLGAARIHLKKLEKRPKWGAEDPVYSGVPVGAHPLRRGAKNLNNEWCK